MGGQVGQCELAQQLANTGETWATATGGDG